MPVAKKIINMLLLKAAPQDLPYSIALLARVIFLYFVTGIVIAGRDDPSLAFAQIMLNISIILSFGYVILSSLNLMPRFVQTITALIGTGVIFNILAWPILAYDDIEQASAFSVQVLSLFILMLISWEILVSAHIFRHALGTKMTQAVILSMALFFVTLSLSQLIFSGAS